MKDWLITLALAVGAFAAFYTLFVNRGVQPPPISRPLSIEAGPNGYMGMARWLQAQRLEPVVWRDRFTSLARAAIPARGNLLISTAPHRYPLRNSEFAPLRRWIEAGNTLLLVAALSDTPEWAGPGEADRDLIANFEGITGLKPVNYVPPEKSPQPSQPQLPANRVGVDGRLLQTQERELVPNRAHPLLEGVKRVQSLSEYGSDTWRLELQDTPLALELARSAQSGAPVLWLMRVGRGQIIISGFGSLFTNKLLDKADNAQLLANIVAWSLYDHGRVVIDDAHQGFVAYYDPQAFFGDRRLHRTLWCMLLLWLVFVLGSQRLRLTTQQWRPADLTSFVRAIGGFMARALEPKAAARQMFSLFFGEVRRRTGLPSGATPPWDWLQVHSGVDAEDLARLRQLHGAAQANRRVNLQQLHNLLTKVRSTWLQH